MAGRPHQKKMAQVERAKKLEAKVFTNLSWARLRGVCFFTNIYPQIKEDTEMAKNAMPGREGPDNPLESTDDGNIRCKVVLLQLTLAPRLGRLVIYVANGLTQVCDCIMNSGAQAQAHLNGTKHRHRMDKVRMQCKFN